MGVKERELQRRLNDLEQMMNETRATCMLRLRAAHERLLKARVEFEEAMLDAESLRIGASTIAREIGMSEAGVRGYLKRRKK